MTLRLLGVVAKIFTFKFVHTLVLTFFLCTKLLSYTRWSKSLSCRQETSRMRRKWNLAWLMVCGAAAAASSKIWIDQQRRRSSPWCGSISKKEVQLMSWLEKVTSARPPCGGLRFSGTGTERWGCMHEYAKKYLLPEESATSEQGKYSIMFWLLLEGQQYLKCIPLWHIFSPHS